MGWNRPVTDPKRPLAMGRFLALRASSFGLTPFARGSRAG